MFFRYFAFFFIGFFAVGFYNGRSEVNSDEFLQEHYAEEISTVQLDDQIYLTYTLEGERLYLWDVDSDSLKKFDRKALMNLEQRSSEQNIYGFIGRSVSTVSASAFLGYQLKDILKHSKSIKSAWNSSGGKGTIFGIILGALSGYSVGYWTATYFSIPDHTSPEVSSMLRDTKFWDHAENYVYQSEYKQRMTQRSNGSQLAKELSLMLDDVDVTSENEFNIQSKDFLALRNL